MEFAVSILRSLREPVLVLDRGFRAVMANPSFYETLQIPPGELEGKQVQELISEENGLSHLREVLEVLVAHAELPTDVEVRCTLPGGEHRILTLSPRRIPVSEGEMIVVELRDITTRRGAEEKVLILNAAIAKHTADLMAANRELEAFTHSASHDLKTPLRVTNKIAHLLLREFGESLPSGAVEKVNMILDSTREMAKLIDDLLDFSRVGREPMKKRRFDLTRLVREAVNSLLDELKDRVVEIEVGELGQCQADRSLLKQVVLNLLSNALKFTRLRERTHIVVGVNETDGETVYFVRDNGVGFDTDSLEELFLPFRRGHRSSEFDGSGIGLALAKRIVERHGGRIWGEGEKGEGAAFFFTLGEGQQSTGN